MYCLMLFLGQFTRGEMECNSAEEVMLVDAPKLWKICPG